MDNEAIKRLQKNLTKSAKKAKKFWVRGLIGYTEDSQGFFDVMTIPVPNQLTGKETTLGEYLADLGDVKAPLRTLEDEVE